jgi:hypothetical protein
MAPPPSISHTSSVGEGAGESKIRWGVERPDRSERRLRTAELVDEEVDGRELGGPVDGPEVGMVVGIGGVGSFGDVTARGRGTEGPWGAAAALAMSTLGRGGDSKESIKTVPAC